MLPMTTDPAPPKQYEKLEKERLVHYSDVLFDSNVIRKFEPVAEQRLLALSDLLLAKPKYGHVWFSLTSLLEMLAPAEPASRIEMLTRFRSLYSRFGNRVRFFGPGDFASVVAEWTGAHQYALVQNIDKEVAASIEAGDLVGTLKLARDDWMKQRVSLRAAYNERKNKYKAAYAANAQFRNEFNKNVAQYNTANALEQCDDVARTLIVDFAKQPPDALLKAKSDHLKYPCTWTYALLKRLADYSATLTDGQRNAEFAHLGDVLAAHPNDYLDAYIVASGGSCGMFITNDGPLIDKINFLHGGQPSLIQLQAFTVYDALHAWNPPDGDVRDRSKPIP
ncbi:hypothetical protein [Corallococcus sp. 4LFB]|uniref:hypothetical protein n=1 Tax=Corallococcus sp. 4LFB TaxID=3383249 RepID=UPI003974DA14